MATRRALAPVLWRWGNVLAGRNGYNGYQLAPPYARLGFMACFLCDGWRIS
ncbi:hypothetical protein LG3211_2057 [Lysobacter gummosus]|nr:hypothetical protein LG3211_2057 [Lysobacter gummosus]